MTILGVSLRYYPLKVVGELIKNVENLTLLEKGGWRWVSLATIRCFNLPRLHFPLLKLTVDGLDGFYLRLHRRCFVVLLFRMHKHRGKHFPTSFRSNTSKGSRHILSYGSRYRFVFKMTAKV